MIVHEDTAFQEMLICRGGSLSGDYSRWSHGQKIKERMPSTYCPPQLSDEEKNGVFAMFFIDEDTKEEIEAEIEEGLEILSSRFKSNPLVPDVPDYVSEEQCRDPKFRDLFDVEDVQDLFPSLNEGIISALLGASDCDRHPTGLMIPVGNHFASQNWDDDQLKKWVCSVHNYPNHIRPITLAQVSSKSRPDLIAKLTCDFIMLWGDCVSLHALKHTAGIVNKISTEELKELAGKEGIAIDPDITRSSLVVMFIEYIFADVLEA